MLRLTFFTLTAILCLSALSCSTKVEMPRGTRAEYKSATIIQRNPGKPITDPTERQVYGMIQKSISKAFVTQGIDFGTSPSDLTVAFLVIYQDTSMTANYPAYFAYGREKEQIAGIANLNSSAENKGAGYFKRPGILIDIIDNKTNKLVYRKFAKGDVVTGVSFSGRSSSIRNAVKIALADFFR